MPLAKGTPEDVRRADRLRANRLRRAGANLGLRATRLLQGVDVLRATWDPEVSRGLLAGSIISSHLAYPDTETGELVYEQAGAGQYLAYDFRRPSEFKKKRRSQREHRQLREGTLFGVLLEEVKGRDPEHKTSTSLLNINNMEHLLRITSASVEMLVGEGMLAATTYQQAYEEVGAYEQFAEDLTRRRLNDEPLHSVTPKGNTLVWILDMSGDPDPEPKPDLALERELGRGLRIA